MKERKQKNPKQGTYPQKNRTVSEGYVGGLTYLGITKNNLTNNGQLGHGLLEFIVSPSNLNAAYRQVKRNRGAGGIDKIKVGFLKDYLVKHKDELMTAIEKGKYCPNPVRRLEIPKEKGSKRQLGIPAVVDRVIQQAITQVLTPIYEPHFSTCSYGFRPKRNAHQALQQCRKHITKGYSYAVDIDLEKFFDKVNHSKLFLRVNREKSKVCHIRQVKFPGYTFYKIKGEGRLRIHPKSVQKMKAKIKELTSRSNGWGNERRKEALHQYITGWVQYFKLADMDKLLVRTDMWYRRRIRMVIWKQRKRIRTKLKNLIKLGVNKTKAWEWANTRKGNWHIANSYILARSITNERLSKAGYIFLLLN